MFNADYQFFSRFPGVELPLDYNPGEDSYFDNYHPYFYEFVAEIDSTQGNRLSDYTGWYSVKLLSNSNMKSYDNVINGTELFSASPLIAKAKTLILNPNSTYDPNCILLQQTYTRHNLKKITSKAINDSSALSSISAFLSNPLKGVHGIINSVGLANNSKVVLEDELGNTFSFVFDAGKTLLSSVLSRQEVNSNIQSLNKSRFDAVILSHWDSDHIIGVGDYDSRTLYSKHRLWIAPDINMLSFDEVSLGAIRLACYTVQNCTVYLCNNPDSKIDFGSGTFDSFTVWQGKAHTSGTASHQNNIGLLINISGVGEYIVEQGIKHTSITKSFLSTIPYSNIDILMCGDCVYDNWPAYIKDLEHNILWVPHHGTNKAIPKDIELKETNNGIAIISADDSSYSEPFPGMNHVYSLVQKGYSHILITKQSGNVFFDVIYK